MMKSLKYCFFAVDTGFLLYWTVTALHLIPPQYLYNDYTSPMLVNWNWSFFPLDMLISATGLYSLWLNRAQRPRWRVFALISLVLTSVSGLQAVSYWALAREFDPVWWIPNGFLLVYPLFFIPRLIRSL
ncbi:MAG: DUF5360 family protein [Bacteroidia bacterium]|nr:DUF5360 family protein [Bacteroidia bacterium]